jgi:hypothetical protein
MNMMTENTNLGNMPEVTQATSGEVVSPGASKPVSEWEKLKTKIYEEFAGKCIIVEKENQILIEADGLKVFIEKDTEGHPYDYWTFIIQSKILDMFISTGLLECSYDSETTYGNVEISIRNKWYPEEDLSDCVNAEIAIETIREILQKYEKNYEEGLVAWFFNTFFPDFY